MLNLRLSSTILFLSAVSISSILLGQEVYNGNNLVNIPSNSTKEQIVSIAAGVTPSPRQLNWQRMELTTFLHFSLNTFYDQEWGKGTEDPVRFNPTSLDAIQWVKVCKEAGSKCAIITCKHHDGFCLWPSKYTDHSVAASPWKNGKGDIIKEVADACRNQGIGFGVYLSPWDRHEKTYGTDAYNNFFINQLTELLTQYGPIAEVWFDGACGEGPNGKKQVYDWESCYKLIRKLQPDAVIAVMGPDVRWVGTESGYGRETEWSVIPNYLTSQNAIASGSQQLEVKEGFIPAGDMTAQDLGSREAIQNAGALIWYPSEVDVSIRPGWFWHEGENERVKTPETLLDIYYSSVGRNSLLLLNIPPDNRGLVHENDVATLREWRTMIDNTFRINFAENSYLSSTIGKEIKDFDKLFDHNDETNWDCYADEPLNLELNLNGNKTFDVLLLQENIKVGQRIEKFSLQAEMNGKWETVTEGTTVGYKRLLRFKQIIANKVRLIIDQSRLKPALSEFGLYLQPPAVNVSPARAAFIDSVEVELNSNSNEAKIFYTLDGSVPNEQSIQFSHSIILKKSAELSAVAIRPDGSKGFISKGSYTKAAYNVTLANAPDEKYRGRGSLGLVDGAEGSLDFTDGKWTGFNGVELIATIDLGVAKDIHTITASFLEVTASWIFKPREVSISISQDGREFTEIRKQLFDVPGEDHSERFSVSGNYSGKAKYIRVTGIPLQNIPDWHPGKGNKSWVFIDEIKIK